MNRLYVIDAGVWVSKWVKSDQFHEISYQWIENVVSTLDPIVEPAIALPAEAKGLAARVASDGQGGRQI